jgi:hypothetical protein
MPAGPFSDWVSLNQSYSVKGVHDVVPVELPGDVPPFV